MKNSWIVALGLLISQLTWAASFGGNTEFTATVIEGDLHLTCFEQGKIETRYVTCRDMILDPYEFGYFDAEKEVDADEAIIVSQRSDGKTVEKKVGYDATTGRSTKRVNLWIETVFQTALLDVGDNPISYQLTKNGEVKASGQFVAKVTEAPKRFCPYSSENSPFLSDCQFPDNMCDRYFRSYNYCQ